MDATGNDELEWKTIINHAVDAQHERDRQKGRQRSSNTQRFPIVTMMKRCLDRFRFFWDIYLGQLCEILGLSTLVEELLSLSISDGRLLLTANYFPTQSCQNNFDNDKHTGSGFFIIVTGAETSDFRVAAGSHKNVEMPIDERPLISNLMELNHHTFRGNLRWPLISETCWYGLKP